LGESESLGNSGCTSFKPEAFNSPWPHWRFQPTPIVGVPVVTLGYYMSAIEGLDRLSQFVRATKAGTVGSMETNHWASVIASVILARPELNDAVAVIPVPRRVPERPNDMADLAGRVASETGKLDGTDLLIRAQEPSGGEIRARRERFPPEEHARTMAVDFEHPVVDRLEPGSKVILLDNVLTYGGTMEGARRAFVRNLPLIGLVGLAVLVSGDYAICT